MRKACRHHAPARRPSKNRGIRGAFSVALKHFVDVPYTQGIEAVISGNFSSALVTWCSMAPLKFCCSPQPLQHQVWPQWYFNFLLLHSALSPEAKGSSVLQGPGWVSTASVSGNPLSLILENVQRSSLQVS